MLFNEPKLLKCDGDGLGALRADDVSVLFNEPKLLKLKIDDVELSRPSGFSALQRAEIAEIEQQRRCRIRLVGFSALQRAEIAEIQALNNLSEFAVEFQCSSTSRNC